LARNRIVSNLGYHFISYKSICFLLLSLLAQHFLFIFPRSLTVSREECLEKCHNQYDADECKKKEQSGGKDRSSKDDDGEEGEGEGEDGDTDEHVGGACNVKGGDQEISCDCDTGNSNSSQGTTTKRERKKSLRNHHHHHEEKDGGTRPNKTGDSWRSSDDEHHHHHVVGCWSDCDSGVVCDHDGGGGGRRDRGEFLWVV